MPFISASARSRPSCLNFSCPCSVNILMNTSSTLSIADINNCGSCTVTISINAISSSTIRLAQSTCNSPSISAAATSNKLPTRVGNTSMIVNSNCSSNVIIALMISGFEIASVTPKRISSNKSTAVVKMVGKASATLLINPTIPSVNAFIASSLPVVSPFNPSRISCICGKNSDSMVLLTIVNRCLSVSNWSPNAAPALTASSDIIMPVSLMLSPSSST